MENVPIKCIVVRVELLDISISRKTTRWKWEEDENGQPYKKEWEVRRRMNVLEVVARIVVNAPHLRTHSIYYDGEMMWMCVSSNYEQATLVSATRFVSKFRLPGELFWAGSAHSSESTLK